MKKYIVTVFLIGILTGFGVCYVYFSLRDLDEESTSLCHVQTGIFYYLWYDPAESVSWEYPKICDKPVLGYYNSCDSEVIRRHFVWLSDLRINFVIISWWGFYNQSRWNSFINNATHKIFKIAREDVTNVKFCIMVEPFNWTNNPTYNFTEIYDYVYDNFITSYPTVYYDYEGKPLICFFNDKNLTPNGNMPKDSRFTIKIVGQQSYADWIYTDLISVTGPTSRNKQISVTPRFDDSRFRTPSHIVDKDLCEEVYDQQWERAIEYAKKGMIDVITICSWNEYPERTAIEPHWDADAYDHSPYFLYYKTRKYINVLKGETPDIDQLRESAYSYLVNSYNSTLGLCYENPQAKNVYWVSNDNVLASYVLQQWNREIADNITETVKRIAKEYDLLTSQTGIPLNCRAEILLGYNVDHFFNVTELVTLNPSYHGAVLKTERATNGILPDFDEYADLLCYASLVEWRKGNNSEADYYYEKVKAMWDGNGFKDKAFDGSYATYKLGLFYFVNKMLGKGSFAFEKELIQRVWQCQDSNGGFKTNYYGNGSFPICYTNTETTSIILLSGIPETCN